MKKMFVVCLAALIFPALALAHPGKQDAKGCHICRKNCDAWSVPWNVKHCHGGRKDAPVPFKRIRLDGDETPIPADEKFPGWEYGMRVKQVHSHHPHNLTPTK